MSNLGKIFAKHMKMYMNKYFEDHNLILKNNHGGLQGKSTMTHRAVIDHKIEYSY